ncbi:hypothetical protein GLOTRDRAFT_121223 [Gloeophyllum trabeum ATCC 11539]|uniref:Uncharacterized protein n=1 Tax=Gloeophyllum trabeum (strain ATCC 11539 / FP-39264 / Madison 617) TaxID=670483 RepID=S7RRX5_GLOTA|nr:uncharacterized protein GLOTRDRAFT_121223 [Gloeophyllum trabeum ATCC 11539]EPQ55764.1 hypothetical protein GLOTRDRAFT_121223 [Gloeophyllum trabeum ATCC 11539]
MVSPSTLNLTALSAVNGQSVFECWALQPGFVSSAQPGTAGAISLQLGNLANASYAIIPAGFDAGRHNAPNVQYVVFLSGLAHITLPNSTQEAWVQGGRNGMIFAADTADVSLLGHSTAYPSGDQTVAMQIPTEGGLVPNHTVLHSGPCVVGTEYKRNLIDLD